MPTQKQRECMSRKSRNTAVTLLLRGVVVAACFGVAGACSEVPEEAVTLSVTVGKDLEELHRSHLAMADAYFARMREDINRFVDDVYRPQLLERFFRSETYPVNSDGLFEPNEERVVGKLPVIRIIGNEIGRPGSGEAIEFMAVVADEGMRRIEERRLSLLAPLDQQELEVKRAITDAYTNVINGHAVVTAHLASVRKVQEAQDEFLGDIGLADVRTRFIDTTAAVSKRVSVLLEQATSTSESFEDLEKALEDVKGQFKNWGSNVKGD